jgi:hypothetical protein
MLYYKNVGLRWRGIVENVAFIRDHSGPEQRCAGQVEDGGIAGEETGDMMRREGGRGVERNRKREREKIKEIKADYGGEEKGT